MPTDEQIARTGKIGFYLGCIVADVNRLFESLAPSSEAGKVLVDVERLSALHDDVAQVTMLMEATDE